MIPRPAAGHLLVNPCKDEETTKGGIILDVKTVKTLSPYIRAVVVKRGAGTRNYPMSEFRHNETNGKEIVLIPRSAGTVLEIDGTKYRIIHSSEVIGYWDNGETQERNR